MERHKIIELSKKNFENKLSIDQIREKLKENYDISYGEYEVIQLKKALNLGNPFYVHNSFITGYDDKGFITSNESRINISKMVKAVIIEDTLDDDISPENNFKISHSNSDPFIIMGKNEWHDFDLSDFNYIFKPLKVGEVFLPPHSAVINFMKQTDEMKDKKIVSMLSGVNINVYDSYNYIDNVIHEIGHLFYRECLTYEEKKKCEEFFKNLKVTALYEYEWEKQHHEEVFCTLYKWYVKSILINKSFYNIFEYEDPQGLNMLHDIFERIARDKVVRDIFELNKSLVFDYLRPRYDKTTRKKIVMAGTRDKINDMELPREILMDIDRVQYGTRFCRLDKAGDIVVPVKDNKIDFKMNETMKAYAVLNKAVKKPVVYVDMDGVVADFVRGYKEAFNRDPSQDDSFTIEQNCQQVPNFFRLLPVLYRGRDLVNELKSSYKIIFLTTPMKAMSECRSDKVEWVKTHFGDYDIIFSDSKADYAKGQDSILIDDMQYNLKPWRDTGGTAIDFNKNDNETILKKIEQAIWDKDEVEKVQNQLNTMVVNLKPTDKQKESGIYKKGEIQFKGLNIKIENPKGSIRWGIGFDGQKWLQKMKCHYGYITNGQDGADGDKVDVFIGPHLNKSLAFVVNQNSNGIFDEHKIMLGFEDIDQAEQAYLSNYQKGWDGLESIKQTNTKKLREWLQNGNLKDPY